MSAVADITIKVKVENTYPDTTIFTEREATVPQAPVHDEEALDTWFDEHVWELTGTHESRSDEYAVYEATILECAKQPTLVGKNYTWGG
jgi:hypothetical protein